MNDSNLYGKCGICKKNKFFIRKRIITIPTGLEIMSKKLMCNKCNKALKSIKI